MLRRERGENEGRRGCAQACTLAYSSLTMSPFPVESISTAFAASMMRMQMAASKVSSTLSRDMPVT